MSKSRITNAQLKQELADHTPVPVIAEKYSLTPKGVRNHITRLHKKEREEPAYQSYGKQQAEKLKDQTRINPNNCLQTLLESEKIKTKQLLQKVKELEEEIARLRYEPEIDWNKAAVDTPILVSDDNEEWFKRHFAKYENGEVYAFESGHTSRSDCKHVVYWPHAKLAQLEGTK